MAVQRKSWRRRLLKGSAWLVGLVVVLVAVAYVVLQTEWGKEKVRQLAVDALNGALAGEFEVGRLEGNPLGTPTLVDVVLRDPDGGVVFSIDRVAASVNLWSLTGQQVHIDELRVSGLTFNLRDEAGRIGLLRAFAPADPTDNPFEAREVGEDGPGGGWRVRIDRIVVEDTLVAAGPLKKGGRPVTVRNLTLGGGLRQGPEGLAWTDVSIKGAFEGLPGATEPDVFSIVTRGRSGPRGLRIPLLDVSLGPHSASLSARMEGAHGDEQVAIRIKTLKASLGDLRKRFKLPVKPGDVRVTGSVEGKLAQAEVKLTAESPLGRLTVKGAAGLQNGQPVLDLTLAGRGLAPVKLSPDITTPVEGNVDGLVRLEGNPAGKGHLDASVTFSALRGVQNLPPVIDTKVRIHRGFLSAYVSQDPYLTVEVAGPLESPYGFDILGRDIDVGVFARAAGVEGIGTELRLIDGYGEVQLLEGRVGVLLVADISADNIDVDLLPEHISASAVTGRLDFHYPGWGIPLGKASFVVNEAVVAPPGVAEDRRRTADRITLNVETVPGDAGQVAASGSVGAYEVRMPEGTVGEAVVPLDLKVSELDWRPSGTVGLKARDVAVSGIAASTLSTSVKLTPDPDRVEDLRARGTFKLRRLAVSATATVGAANGRFRGKVDRTGRWSATTDLAATSVNVAGQRFNRVATDLKLGSMRSTRGGASGVSLSGSVDADGWVMSPTVGARKAAVTIESLVLGRGFPAGTMTFDLTDAKALRPVGRLAGDVELGRNGVITVKALGRGGQVDRDVYVDVELPVGGRRSTRIVVNQLKLRDRRGDGFVIKGSVVDLHRGGRITTSGVRLKEIGRGSGNIKVSGSFRTGRGPIDLNAQLRSVEVSRWVRYFEDLTGVAITLPGKLAGRIDLTVDARRRKGEFAGDLSLRVAGLQYDMLNDVRGQLRGQLGDGWVRLDGTLHERELAEPLRFDNFEIPARVFSGKRPWRWGDLRRTNGSIDVPSIALSRFEKYLPKEVFADQVKRSVGGRLVVEAREPIATSPTIRLTVVAQEVRHGKGGRRTTKGTLIARPDLTSLKLFRGKPSMPQQIAIDAGVTHSIIEPLLMLVRGDTPSGGWKEWFKGQRSQLVKAKLAGKLSSEGVLLGDLPMVPSQLSAVRVRAFGRKVGPGARRAPLRFLGTVGSPRAEGWLIAERLPLPDGVLGRVDVRFDGTSQDKRTAIQLALPGQVLGTIRVALPSVVEELLKVGGVGDVLKNPGLDVEVFTEALPAAVLAPLSEGLAQGLEAAVPEGRTTVYARLTGARDGPRLRLEARTERRQKAYVASLMRSLLVSVDLDPKETRAYAMAGQGPDGGMLIARGGLAVGTGRFLEREEGWVDKLMQEPLSGALVSTDFRLDKLEHILPSVFTETKGWLDANVNLAGTAGDPILEGYSDVRFDEVELKLVGRRSDKPFDVGLYFHDRLVELCRAAPRGAPPSPDRTCVPLQFQKGDGSMTLSLLMRLPKLDPAVMALAGRVDMKKFDLFGADGLQLNADSSLAVGGTVAVPSLTGDMTINSAKFVPDVGGSSVQTIGLPEDVRLVKTGGFATVRSAQKGGAILAPLEFAGRFPMIVDVTTVLPKEKVQVVNPFIDARPHGKLRARTDTNGVLRVSGRVWVNDGVFRPFDREFTFLDDSYVDFTGDPAVDPVLHIRASYSIADVDLTSIGKSATPKSAIKVAIDGKAGGIDGEPKLSSDPAMTKEQMMATIVLGTPAASSGETNTEALSEAALAALGFSQALREGFFFLDRIAFVPSNESVRLHVGKELGDNLWGYYDFNLNAPEGESQHVIRVEWRFSEGWRLETRLGDFQEGSLEMLYRYQY